MRTFLRGKITLLFITIAVVLAVPAIALADTVNVNQTVDNVIVTTNATKAPGDTGTATVYLTDPNSPSTDVNGCNATGSSPAKVYLKSNNAGVTIDSPGYVELTGCGTENAGNIGYSVSSTASGTATISVDKVEGGRSGSVWNMTDTLTINIVATDTTPPATPTLDLATASDSGSSNSDDVTNDNTPTFEGYAEAGSTVKIYDGAVAAANLLGSATANGAVDPSDSANKAWTFTVANANAPSDGVHTIHATATDASNNTSTTPADLSVRIDTVNPVVSFVDASAFNSNPSFDFGSVPSAPTCSATDTGGSGVDGTCQVGGYGTAVGNYTLTATANDIAGNSGSATPLTYSVLAAKANGFYSPVDMGTVTNTVKGGSTVPLKFELFGGASNTEQKALSAVSSVSAKQIACGTTPASSDAIEEIVSTSATGLRFDTTGDQFIYNWKTPKSAGTCYLVTMTAADQQTKLLAYFKLS